MSDEIRRRARRQAAFDNGQFDNGPAPRCPAVALQPYPWAQRHRHDHRCRLPEGHDGPHYCPCNKRWRHTPDD